MRRSELEQVLRKQIRRANQKLYRLEKKELETSAYNIAMNDISNSGGKKRFKIPKNATYQDLQRIQAQTRRFTNSASSGVRGIKQYVKAREKTFASNYSDELKSSGKKSLKDINNAFNFLNSREARILQELNINSDKYVRLLLRYGKDARRLKTAVREAMKAPKDDSLADGGVYQFLEDFVDAEENKREQRRFKRKMRGVSTEVVSYDAGNIPKPIQWYSDDMDDDSLEW